MVRNNSKESIHMLQKKTYFICDKKTYCHWKTKKPRCFIRMQYCYQPIYETNLKIWMTSALSEKIISQLGWKSRKYFWSWTTRLAYLNIKSLKFVKLVFLPTPHQCCSQWIRMLSNSLKVHFRKLLDEVQVEKK